MRVRDLPENLQLQQDPEWLREFTNFLNKNGNKKNLESVKKIFIQTYLEGVQEGMNPGEALQKAKSVALCFLFLQCKDKTEEPKKINEMSF